jgi:hypothetical protein
MLITHVGINDMKSENFKKGDDQQKAKELISIIESVQDKCSKIVVSLVVPTCDQKNSSLNARCYSFNAQIELGLKDLDNVIICRHDNMASNGSALQQFICPDGIHLSADDGVPKFAANLKYSLRRALRVPRNTDGGRKNRNLQTDNTDNHGSRSNSRPDSRRRDANDYNYKERDNHRNRGQLGDDQRYGTYGGHGQRFDDMLQLASAMARAQAGFGTRGRNNNPRRDSNGYNYSD